jgi:meiotic recombination protein SPO11
VQSLHRELDLPVVGICDSNPFGISVLALYHCAGDRMGVDGNMKYSVPIRWIGLRPSTVADLEDQLPKEVFQKLTDRDYKRIDALLDETHSFLNEAREEEILTMKDAGYKVELEALYWLGPDYMGNWVVEQLEFIDDEDEWEIVAI